MPNWCSCALIIEGPEVSIEAFKHQYLQLEGKPLTVNQFIEGSLFNLIIPMPRELRKVQVGGTSYSWYTPGEGSTPLTSEEINELRSKYGTADWYSWAQSNWGTKWDVSHYIIESSEPTRIKILFSTAWSPPSPVTRILSSQYRDLRITLAFAEQGIDFWGFEVYEAGDLVEYEESDNCFQESLTEEGELEYTPEFKAHLDKFGIDAGG